MRLLLISLFLAGVAFAQTCMSGYTAYDNMCRKVIPIAQNRYDASGVCDEDGARLVKITNAFVNNQVALSAGNLETVWLGLECATSDLASCFWDDGTTLGGSAYQNFFPGHPDTYIGTCVYMYISLSSMWHSTNCTITPRNGVCEYDSTLRGSATCKGDSPYHDDEKQKIVKIHNDLRSKIALGNFVAKTDKKSAATNMQMMSWSCELENQAQAFADHCTFSKSNVPTGPIPNVGQSIYSDFVRDDTQPSFFKGSGIAAATNWESVLQKKGWASNNMTADLLSSGIASGTQMTWWNSNQIGCGVARCPAENGDFKSERIVVCQYLAPGNLINQMVYNEGPTCSACSKGFVCDQPTGFCKQQ